MNVSGSFACNLIALTPSEREHWRDLARVLKNAVRGVDELRNGYALHLDVDSMSTGSLETFLSLERRCCPFLAFTVRQGGGPGQRILEVTGQPGVKRFLAKEFSLGSVPSDAG